MNKKSKTPWPTKAVMTQVYEQHLWGGKEFDFFSGDGSHNPDIIKPYLKAIISFLKSHDNALSLCDLGCGDFNIGQRLLPYTSTYFAVDIVDALIERNKILFPCENLEFKCLDISKDDLPEADCVILRQVLQHLSNSEITRVVKKLKDHKFIILTEHIPTGKFVANKDIISGQGIRLKQNSGVDLLAAPFNLKVVDYTVLNTVILNDQKGQIVTTLFTL